MTALPLKWPERFDWVTWPLKGVPLGIASRPSMSKGPYRVAVNRSPARLRRVSRVWSIRTRMGRPEGMLKVSVAGGGGGESGWDVDACC